MDVATTEQPGGFTVYPDPLATHEDVLSSSELFLSTLSNFHTSIGGELGRIPHVAGKELDLHLLYVQVTSKGGIQKVIEDKKWKEIAAVFDFPKTTTSGSFMLRKFYIKLLFHYEKVYFFRLTGARQPEPAETVYKVESEWRREKEKRSRPRKEKADAAEGGGGGGGMGGAGRSTGRRGRPKGPRPPTLGSRATGVVDSRFMHGAFQGYFVTVTVNGEEFKGMMYHQPEPPDSVVLAAAAAAASQGPSTSTTHHAAHSSGTHMDPSSTSNPNTDANTANTAVDPNMDSYMDAPPQPLNPFAPVPPTFLPHLSSDFLSADHSRKKPRSGEKRDPCAPKMNKTAFNYFSAEMRIRLRQSNPSLTEKEMTRTISEMWAATAMEDKQPYMEAAEIDKQRYHEEQQQYLLKLASMSQHHPENCAMGTEVGDYQAGHETITGLQQNPNEENMHDVHSMQHMEQVTATAALAEAIAAVPDNSTATVLDMESNNTNLN